MEYGAVIQEAWQATWRHRSLWVLGLFAGGASGIPTGGGRMQFRGNPPEFRDLQRVSPEVGRAADAAARWVLADLGLVFAAAAVVVALALLALVVSLIAQGGLARATIDLAAGHPTSLGRAWSAGVRLFWRFVGLWLLLAVAALIVAAVFAAVIALAVGLGALGGAPRVLGAVLGVLLDIPLVLAGLALAIAAGIVVAYAQRAIAAADLGPLAAIRSGWRLLRAHPGTSFLVWLVNVALAIGAGIAIAIAAGIPAVILVVVGVVLWAAAGLGASLVAYAVLAGLLLLAAVLALAAASNTFFWHYWTRAYLRLSAPDAPGAAAPAGT